MWLKILAVFGGLELLAEFIQAVWKYGTPERAARKGAPGKAAHGALTPERQVIYEMAIEYLRNPKALRAMAEEFERQGLPTLAARMKKRAAVQELPAEKKAERRDAYRKARASTNVDGILKVAEAFEDDGSPGAAYNLRSYAEGIKAAVAAGQTPATPADLPATSDEFLQNNGFAGDPDGARAYAGSRPPSFGGRRRRRRGRGRPAAPPQAQQPTDGDDPNDGGDDGAPAPPGGP